MLALFIILAVVFFAAAAFLGLEMFKKFRFMRSFVSTSNQLVEWHYPWPGKDSPGMYNIVLRGKKPFTALVGFHLRLPILGEGFDYYGFVQSGPDGVAVISTYLGSGPCTFQFFVNTDLGLNQIVASSMPEDQWLSPQVVYPPHWWQKLGLFG